MSMLSDVYRFFVNYRLRLYEKGRFRTEMCNIPVISIGNISTGGSGKTPFTQLTAEILRDLGRFPAIVGRGYKRKSKGEIIVCDGHEILASAETAGDEMFMLAENTHLPIIAHDKKFQGALSAEKMFPVDSIIIDDGFQHLKIFRDLDVLLIDDNSFNNPFLMPRGRLREPFENVWRADVIGIFDENNYRYLKRFITPAHLILHLKYENRLIYDIFSKEVQNIDNLRPKYFTALCGIAKPRNFITSLDSLNLNIDYVFAFPDHFNYEERNLIHICKTISQDLPKNIITTEKDAVKIKKFKYIFDDFGIKCYVLPITINIVKGKQDYIEKIEEVFDEME